MSKETNVKIGLITENDLGAAMRLQKPERWNQTERDWRRLIRLEPHGCFGAWLDGRLVGTLTTTTYGKKLAWIGMVLVDSKYRRTGIATRLMRATLDWLQEANILTVKLDATPAGQPIYQSLGFECELLIERWSGLAHATTADDRLLGGFNLPEILEFDRRVFGADRSSLLGSLIKDARISPLASARPDGRLSGYALAREGNEACYVGPIVAEDASTARALLSEALHRLDGQQVYIDLNTAFAGGAQEVAASGLSKQRSLTRMRYGNCSKVSGDSGSIFAIAGPEFG
jgi:GNAT superfamily N-acetyltransferase